jgi:DNA-directed RNA polymerase subunit F
MKVIKQQEEIRFCAINLKEAVTLLPLMDALTNIVNNNRVASLWESLPKEDKEIYRKVYTENNIYIQPEMAEKILDVLFNLGFESMFDLKDASLDDLKRK